MAVLTEEQKAAYARQMRIEAMRKVNSPETEAFQQSGGSRAKSLFAAENAQHKLVQTSVVIQNPHFKEVKENYFIEGTLVAMQLGTRVELVKGKKPDIVRIPIPASLGDLVSASIIMSTPATKNNVANQGRLKGWYCAIADMSNEEYDNPDFCASEEEGQEFRDNVFANAFIDNIFATDECFVKVVLNPSSGTDDMGRATSNFMNPAIWVNWTLTQDCNASIAEIRDWTELWPDMALLAEDSTSGMLEEETIKPGTTATPPKPAGGFVAPRPPGKPPGK